MTNLYFKGSKKDVIVRDVGSPSDPTAEVTSTVTGNFSTKRWIGSGEDSLIGTSTSDLIFLHNTNFNLPMIVGISVISAGGGNDVVDMTSTKFRYGDITILGGAGKDWLLGNDGNDRISGNSGADRINGYGGNDILIGGTGADELYGGSGRDTASYADAKIGVTANLRYVSQNTNDALGDTYSSIENLEGSKYADKLYGDLGNNVLRGGAGADILRGDAGNDVLDGGTEADRMYGGTGNDTYFVDNINDKVVELADQGVDKVKASINFSLMNSQVENLQLTGTLAVKGIGNGFDNLLKGQGADNVLIGKGGDDKLLGGSGSDRLSGNGGDDILEGQKGDDVLRGGGGDDHFVFRRGGGDDRILDFHSGQDVIEIHSGAHSFTDLEISQAGSGAMIAFADVSIRLNHVTPDHLTADDFIFT